MTRIEKVLIKLLLKFDVPLMKDLEPMLGVTSQTMGHWKKKNKIGRKHAVRIQQLTDGEITVAECMGHGDFKSN